jgi:hypothetical protein
MYIALSFARQLWPPYKNAPTFQKLDYLTIMLSDPALLIFLCFGLILYFSSKTHKRSSRPLPPGPKKLPLLGNILDLPTNQQWKKFIEWGKEFSKLFSVVHLPSSRLIWLTL